MDSWNKWDSQLLGLFKFVNHLVANDGYVAILHSGEHLHKSCIYTAADAANFKLLQSYFVVLPEPMWLSDKPMQVISPYWLQVLLATSLVILVAFSKDFLSN